MDLSQHTHGLGVFGQCYAPGYDRSLDQVFEHGDEGGGRCAEGGGASAGPAVGRVVVHGQLLIEKEQKDLSKDLCLAVFDRFGYVWLCLAMFGRVWHCVAVFGYVWQTNGRQHNQSHLG